MPEEYEWRGTLAFGMVMIPVSVVPAASDEAVSFHLLHDEDNARLEKRMVCPAEGRPVHGEHIIRGFEIAPDEYVTVTNEELESLEPARSRTIFLRAFVDAGSIEPRYYDRPYYMTPLATDVPYAVLAQALARTGKVGIAQLVARGRERMAVVRAVDGGALALLTLRYSEELADPAEAAPAGAEVDRSRLRGMEAAIKRLSRPWDAGRYRDRYVEKVKEFIRKKEEHHGTVRAPEGSEPVELGAALEATLRRMRSRRDGKK